MAGTLHPDKQFERYNVAKEKMGHFFRFKPRSALFNIIWMGIIPASIYYVAYSNEGYISTTDRFRKESVLLKDYVPRSKLQQQAKAVPVEEDDE